MRMVIHAGANKAGSTSLQNWFGTNRDEILSHGVLWPKTGLLHGAHYELSDCVGFAETNLPKDAESVAQLRDLLCQEVQSSGADSVVISSEKFMLERSLETLSRFFDGFQVEVIFALRRHDHWWTSLWSQAVQTAERPPWSSSFESFVAYQLQTKQQHFCYRRLIETWEAFFPGAVHAFPFEAQLIEQGMVPRFLSAAKLDHLASAGLVSESILNISPSVDVLALMDLVQRADFITKEEKQKWIAWAIETKGMAEKPRDLLSGKTRLSLISPHLADYAYLGERFGDKDGLFFREPLPIDDGIDGRLELSADKALALLIRKGAPDRR